MRHGSEDSEQDDIRWDSSSTRLEIVRMLIVLTTSLSFQYVLPITL